MHYSPLLNSNSTDSPSYPLWKSFLTWLCRILIGGVFIYSGFIKAIDPWGTFYKFNDYLNVIGLTIPAGVIIIGVFLLCLYEFLAGIFLLFGCYRKSIIYFIALFMAVMLPLTLWIAIFDPVEDCGCFGDALIISNWATFWKNVIIVGLLVWLFIYNKFSVSLISPAFQWMAFLVSALFLICIGLYGYQVQPLIDFRNYPQGSTLIADEEDESENHFIFVYEKGGKKMEISDSDSIPDEDSGWKFIERKDILPDKSVSSSNNVNEFHIWDTEGNEDVTYEVLDNENNKLIVLIPSVSDISAAYTWKINSLHDWALEHNIEMMAIVAANSGDLEEWKDLSMPNYPIYTADDTSIKEIARGNPAVIYIKDGIIIWKSSMQSLNETYFEEPDNDADIDSFIDDRPALLRNIFLLYLVIMAFLVTISMIPRLENVFMIRKRKVKKDI